MFLGDLNTKAGKKGTFNPTVNKNFHETSDDNVVKLRNFAMSKDL
jgi:hypothetical protein